MPSFRSLLAPHFASYPGLVALLLSSSLVLSASACAGDKEGTNAPTKDKAQLDAEKKEAVQAAKVNQLIVTANQNLASGRYVSARELAEDALAENPNNADAYAILGAAHWRAGDFAASTEALQKSIEIDPTNYGAGVALARNLRAASQYAESLTVLEPIVAAESADFQGKSCEALADCEDVGGWCDVTAKVCKAPVQLEPRMAQLWAHYLTLDTQAGPAIADLLFLSGAAGVGEEGSEEASQLTNKVIRGYADFLRAVDGKGELVEVQGKSKGVGLELDLYTSLLHAPAKVGGEDTEVLLSPLQVESRIDSELAATLGIESLGSVELLHGEYEVGLIPEVEFNGFKIKNVPVLIGDLAGFAGAMPEKPGVILGHQVLNRIGTIVADIPGHTVTFSSGAPDSISSDAAELPLLLLDQWSLHIPATQIGIEGSEHKFWAWLGFYNVAAISVTHKTYLKSGHLPRDIEDPEDPDTGRKMVYVDHVDFGDVAVGGFGGLVYLEQPGEPALAEVRDFSGFELGGSINMPLMTKLKITFSFGEGRIWVEDPGTKASAPEG